MSHLASGKGHSFLGAGSSCPSVFYGGFKILDAEEHSLRKVDKACLPPAFFFTSLYGIPSLRVWTGSFWIAGSQDLPNVVRSACLEQITKFIYGQFRGRLEGRLELVDLLCEREVPSHGVPRGTGPRPATPTLRYIHMMSQAF